VCVRAREVLPPVMVLGEGVGALLEPDVGRLAARLVARCEEAVNARP
jgi:hypothetical protein